MGKRNKKSKRIPTDGPSDAGFGHNPFAAALGDASAPPADPAPTQAAPEAEAEVAPPARAVVRRERKGRGGKTVTVISHLDLPADALESWCAMLRKKAGCGGAVEDGELIVLQGDQRDRVSTLLSEMGVKKVTKS
jgi:translation initiation factor 1